MLPTLRNRREEEAISSKIIDEVYDVLEKYGITGLGSDVS
jgi:hypothetical protein